MAVKQTSDGGYVLVGYTTSFGAGGVDWWLVKTDADGDSLWSRRYGGPENEWCYAVLQTADGGYVLAGGGYSFGAGTPNNANMWLLKTDANGDSLWSRAYGGIDRESAHAMIQTSDGGYALAGFTGSYGAGDLDMWMVRTNANGDSLWSQTFGGSEKEECESMLQTDDGGYILAGYTESFGAGSGDMWLLKTEPDPLSTIDPVVLQPLSYSLASYPNPFNPSTTIVYNIPNAEHISLRVLDLLGREVIVLKDDFVEAGSHRVLFDASNLASGIYFARLDAGSFSQTKKLMLLK
jgi:hypothetical protein